ncbi:MAG: 4Fe-4S binding protein [Elusimicrobia bacterium]|nr:4Fe-4S binding protein [Elusimicrobiota bacterium]
MLPDYKKLFPALVFAALVFVPVAVFSNLIVSREISPFYAIAWALFAGGTAFAVFYTGRVSFFRRIFFSASALAFLIHFKLGLLLKGFHLSCFKDTPYCHIAIAPSFLNYLYQQYLAVMSGGWKLWGPLSLVFLWLFATLVLGRGWCSWTCFYGGIDDGLSALPKKALLKTEKSGLKLRDFPAALLIFLLLISFANMAPSYCLWLCPFKLTGVFLDPDDALIRKIQYGLMGLALAVLVIGPVLTKKRTFCSFLCPFGAWQAFWGRLNPFRVSVDPQKCSGCLACVSACPMYAINCVPGGKAEITAYCNMCGECLKACGNGGINYSVLGFSFGLSQEGFWKLLNPESFFVFAALTLSAVFASFWAPAALRDVLKLIMP